jgi:hypothetical protein
MALILDPQSRGHTYFHPHFYAILSRFLRNLEHEMRHGNQTHWQRDRSQIARVVLGARV